MRTNIYDFVKAEETAYQTLPIQVVDGYEWNMYKHIQLSVLYKNSKYSQNNGDVPFKNIVRPLLNLQYRAEGFDVKDIVIFINNSYKFFKSFLVRKFHEKWARDNEIDTFIDDIVESYVDFGGALIKDENNIKPGVVELQSIAFCDQTSILSGPIAIKHFYAPDELEEMKKKGWKNIDDVIVLSEDSKETPIADTVKSKTPSKYIEVYEVHGVFPSSWLNEEESGDEDKLVRQLHIITMYQNEDGSKHGITLYKGKEKKLPFKIVLRDKIYGRALGLGGVEELFEPQVWANYSVIHMKNMLDQASKIIYLTTDPKFKNQNTNNLDNGQFLTIGAGHTATQLNTVPINIQAFENSVQRWEEQAKVTASANESILGEQPKSGTPFKLQELVTSESHSLHEYRKGKLATFLQSVYRDWIIPHLAGEITEENKFLANLDYTEMQMIADNLVICEANKVIKERILNGDDINDQEIESIKEDTRSQFIRGGNKKFIEILKDELKDAPMDIEIDIVGKQKYLASIVDKLVNVFSFLIKNPQVRDDPGMMKTLNEILEYSGLSAMDFNYKSQQVQQQQIQQPLPQPIQTELLKNNVVQTT